jgi:Uncharacterized protein conserved in bacteria (DUF2059)
MKSFIAALLITASTPVLATPEQADAVTAAIDDAEDPAAASGQKEMDAVMSIFSKMFDTSNLPEPEPARLDLAKVTASKLLPDGAYAKILDDMMASILKPMFNILPGLTDAQIVSATGAPEDAVAALTEENKTAVTQIIDPNYKQRGEQILGVMKPMISEAMAIIEPAMRQGLSRAYARKFSAAQLTAINGFFTTPVGGAFARESFALQADPEVLQATFKALPQIFTMFMADEAKFKAKFDELPKQRELKDLSVAETQQLAQLLGVEVGSLEDHKLLTSAVDPYANETGDEPWYADDSWSPAERKKVKALDAKYNAARTRSEAAAEQATTAYEVYESAWQAAIGAARKRILAEGWTPPPAEPETEPTEDAIDAVAAL